MATGRGACEDAHSAVHRELANPLVRQVSVLHYRHSLSASVCFLEMRILLPICLHSMVFAFERAYRSFKMQIGRKEST